MENKLNNFESYKEGGLSKTIWITWENHRRSRELAKKFNAEYYCLRPIKHYICKLAINISKTMLIVLKERPRIVFCQNPSLFLAFILCLLKVIIHFRLIVDRHSNFKLETYDNKFLKWKIFHLISRYTIRKADLTIVTNQYLCDMIEKWGGSGCVLQDSIPSLDCSSSKIFQVSDHRFSFALISTYSDDEPIDEVVGASLQLKKDVCLYITGRYSAIHKKKYCQENVYLTGFLPEENYQSLLGQVSAIIVLTNKEHLLLCGAYEAVSLMKPLITSNTRCLKEYFGSSIIYCNNTKDSIADSMREVMRRKQELLLEMKSVKKDLSNEWEKRFNKIKSLCVGMA